MLYPKNNTPTLDDALFQNPTAEYRAAPFWAWNNKLDPEQLCRQIECMKKMGFGGYHMHSRAGMATAYLGDEFMAAVTACVEKSKQEDMLAWIYDEDRWPSGHAGGMVTADPHYAQRQLLLSVTEEEGDFLTAYDIVLDENGCLASAKQIGRDDEAQGAKWYATVQITKARNDFNGNPYTDTLNPVAIERFAQITHERYKEVVGADFGKTIPAIFTDEPSATKRNTLDFALSVKPVSLPWTHDLAETFRAFCGLDLLQILPEVVWQLPEGKVSRPRYLFHEHVTRRLYEAYSKTLGDWCDKNGVMLTGHLLSEPSLRSQTGAMGECMRHYRSFGLPGIDMLCDRYEYSTAKQAQSVARQYGRPGILSELYGVTGWHFDFRGHKAQGDWQAALGVTVRVPHLYWVSMAGEAKRDYPAPIGHQSPWWTEYSYIEDHFARLNTALTRGKPVAKIGVIHPIESFWLTMGPTDQTTEQREALQTNFTNTLQWLLFGQLDFDLISEALLPELCPKAANPLPVGEMAYDVIILPGLTTLRRTTLERLVAFQKAGGAVLVMGQTPTMVDVIPSDEAKSLGEVLPFTADVLMKKLAPYRTVEIRNSGSFVPDKYNAQFADSKRAPGKRADSLIYQLRQDGDSRWLFICHGKPVGQLDTAADEPVTICVKGIWKPTLYNTVTGAITPLGADYDGDRTVFEWVLHPCDSLLLRLDAGRADAPAAEIAGTDRSGRAVKGAVPVTLHEDNVLLLDMAEYRLNDDDAWQEEEEILALDNICRLRCGYKKHNSVCLQPWVIPDEPAIHTIHLRVTFRSDVEVSGCRLAMEDAELADVTFNGKPVASAVTGTYVDDSIKTLAMPTVQIGENVLEVSLPFGPRTNTEAMYLLGDFGVKLCGTERTLIAHVTRLGFGSVTDQGLPYYGGNITYHLPLENTEDKELGICHYRGSLMNVSVGDKFMGRIVFPPYRLALRDLPKDAKTIDVTLFGNRHNTFGPLHNYNPATTWWGPSAGRSARDAWGYEYNLRPFGILSGPVVREL